MSNEVLKSNPLADLRVYAVWFPMLRGDSMDAWDAASINDPRAVHFWDEDGVVGKWLLREVTKRDDARIEWDAYFLYGPDARWGVQAPHAISWGRPIIQSRDALQRDLTALLAH